MPPEDIDVVLRVDRELDDTTLEETPGTPYERAAIGRLLAEGCSAGYLCEVVRGIPLLPHAHGRSIASWAHNPRRMERAREAWRRHARAAAERAAARSKRPPRDRMPVYDMSKLGEAAAEAHVEKLEAELVEVDAAILAADDGGRAALAARRACLESELERLRARLEARRGGAS